jgi:hypothetical protein
MKLIYLAIGYSVYNASGKYILPPLGVCGQGLFLVWLK